MFDMLLPSMIHCICSQELTRTNGSSEHMRVYTYVRIVTQNDNNGNPRRLDVVSVVDTDNVNSGAERVSIIEEGYEGESRVRKHFPSAMRILEVVVAPVEYNRWMRVKKSDEQYAKDELKRIAGIKALGEAQNMTDDQLIEALQ